MSAEMDAVFAAVERNTSVTSSVIAYIGGLKAKLEAAGTDPDKLKELADEIEANSTRAAAAIVANTDAAASNDANASDGADASADASNTGNVDASNGAPATDAEAKTTDAGSAAQSA